MPWCSGNVAVPSGCSTALVMNCAPGHAPQLPPPAVDALAGTATAPAGMARAESVVRPNATLAKLVLRNLVVFIGCPFLRRGTNLAGGQRPPRCFAHPVGVRSGPDLRSSGAHTRARRVAAARG